MSRNSRKKKHKPFIYKDLNLDAVRKQLLRAWVRARLRAQTPSARKRASRKIAKTVFGLTAWKRAKTVLAFASLPTEVDTAPIVDRALKEGKCVALPIVDLENKELKLCSIKDRKRGFVTGPLGIREPDPKLAASVPAGRIDLVLVPALAYDRSRGRLGRGGGFYDRWLGRHGRRAATVGLAFSFQIFSGLPLESHDRRVKRVVTEKETF